MLNNEAGLSVRPLQANQKGVLGVGCQVSPESGNQRRFFDLYCPGFYRFVYLKETMIVFQGLNDQNIRVLYMNALPSMGE